MAEAPANQTECNKIGELSECAVCLQTCVHPAKLPCGHIFCYLCVKGFANQNKRCAMCRQEIPRDFVDQPQLLESAIEASETFDGGYQWFYEGCNGWWQYDERTSKELENSYKKGEKSIELLIAGFLYIVDFESMLQLRRNDPSRRRQVKRDVSTISKKGIAGIRTSMPSTSAHSESYPLRASESHLENTASQLPITPSNTPQSRTSGRESPNQDVQELQATMDLMTNLELNHCNSQDSGNDHMT